MTKKDEARQQAEEPNNQTTPNPQEDQPQSLQESIQEDVEKIFEHGADEFARQDNDTQEESPQEESPKEEPLENQEGSDQQTSQQETEEKQEGEEKTSEEETSEEKKEEEAPARDDQKLLEKYNLTKFKSIDDALEAYKNLEKAYTKAQQLVSAYQKGMIPEDIKEGIEGVANIIKQPRVNINPPDPTNYLNDGQFDIASYLKDALTEYTLSLQQSLAFGPLASALYTVQKAAISDVYGKLTSEYERDQQAVAIQNAIYEEFPVLKEDEALAKKVARAITGEAQLKGEPLTKEEVLKVVAETVGEQKQVNQEPEKKPVEQLRGSLPLSEQEGVESKKKDAIEQAVDEVFNLSQQESGALF